MADGEHLEKLESGLNILVEVKSGLFRGNYLSRISKLDKKEIFIESPEDKSGQEIKFWAKTLIFLSFFRENEPGAIYEFSAHIARVEEGVKKTIVVDIPESIERIQRRNYVRVDLRLPFYFQGLSLEDNNTPLSPLRKGYIMDVSGGGVFLRTSEKLEKDQIVRTKFDLGDENFEIDAKIVRVIENKRGTSFMYKYGVLFDDIVDMIRRRIIGYVFEIERNNIRKQKEVF
ncbi:MAG: PilZ domain-containing protein [Candidatus Muirbacterium halophilum]|nr:PilZ domain-containing protein [Candidatus Muirbacterium halophilum]MCK9477424.1 PilZ domain-containing protein [Candidatus Muirbacterium halophilum]